MKLDKSKLDVSQIFLVYMATVGDVVKTATALDMSPEIVQALAENEGWIAKVRRISLTGKSERPGDWERAQNRAMCFVQAHQIRMLISRMIVELTRMTNERLVEHTAYTGQDKIARPSAKVFAELAKAAETCHNMSYAALGDTAPERSEHVDKEGAQQTAAQLHASIVLALSHPECQGKEADMLVREEAEKLMSIAPIVPTERKSLPAPDALNA